MWIIKFLKILDKKYTLNGRPKPLPEQGGRGQAIVEFVFCMIIVMLMFYGLVMIFRWSGLDLAERRIAHEESLANFIDEDYTEGQEDQGPLKQLDTYFYEPEKMNAVWQGE